jgi:hypothetical protein
MKILLSIVTIVLFAMATCRADDGGGWGGCSYVRIEGRARIVSITAPGADEYNCADAVKVTFDFSPDDPDAADHYLMPEWPDKGQHLTILGGGNPPRGWVLLQGLTEGSEHECIRNEITTGTCTPVIFEFPHLDQAPEKVNCFAVGRYCVDHDGDGYDGVPNCGSLDCNDSDAAIKPGAPEVPDGIDNDCDWLTDEDYTTTSSLVPTSSTTSTVIPSLPSCDNSTCDDGSFCNGAETCEPANPSADSNGCLAGTPPCTAEQLCREATAECWEVETVEAHSVQPYLMRPLIFSETCTWLAVKAEADNYFDQNASTISVEGPSDNAGGVSVNPGMLPFAFMDFIFLPLCVEQDAAAGQWTAKIETDVVGPSGSLRETIKASFAVR